MAHKGWIVCGLGWGDEGKGAVTAGLAALHKSTLCVRFGGCQAAHNVIHNGVHHRFSQFGSAMLLPNTRTHLSRHMLIEPFALMEEGRRLIGKGVADVFSRITVDPGAVIVTPWHWMANQVREICRAGGRHGSTGQGIGECRSQELRGLSLHVSDIRDRNYARMTLNDIRRISILSLPDNLPVEAGDLYHDMYTESVSDLLDFYRDWSQLLEQTYMPEINGPVVIEGSQGLMLDETHGTAPHNTWLDCTFNNGLDVCREWKLEPVKVGVLRTYSTRHGAGPFIVEDPAVNHPDHNKMGRWQGSFRQGPLDLVAAEYAAHITRPDCLALTHMDRVPEQWRYCQAYDKQTDMRNAESLADARPVFAETGHMLATISDRLNLPVRYTTSGPATNNFNFGTGVAA